MRYAVAMDRHPIGTTPAPGERLDGTIFGPRNNCFACGPNHPEGFRLTFAVDGDEVVTRFVPRASHAGAPTIMHGGLVTTVADEVGCWALIALRGKFGFTGTMTSRFARPVRVERETVGRARITKESTRMVHVDVRVLQEDAVCFSSVMSFVIPNREGAESMLGKPLPEEWHRFFR